MEIEGKLGTYNVRFRRDAGSWWCQPVVRVRRKIKFLPFSRWVTLFSGEDISKTRVNYMLPNELRGIFNNAVCQYEAYKTAWDKEQDK